MIEPGKSTLDVAQPDPNNPLPATTTLQQDLTHEGQRKVNLIWEYTQAILAVLVVGANIALWIIVMFHGMPAQTPAPESLKDAMLVIITFYYARTNHEHIGGVGFKPSQYQGR
jgi:hypothetical protein